jgi:hypothetical protein
MHAIELVLSPVHAPVHALARLRTVAVLHLATVLVDEAVVATADHPQEAEERTEANLIRDRGPGLIPGHVRPQEPDAALRAMREVALAIACEGLEVAAEVAAAAEAVVAAELRSQQAPAVRAHGLGAVDDLILAAALGR